VKAERFKSEGESGYILLAILLLMTLMLIALTVEAPRIAQQIKREKEEELIHRGNEYKNAIKKYFRKFGRYPASVEQLENTNNIRFLRKRYKDPFTGKDDWRLLHPGEVQVNPLNAGPTAAGQQPGQPVGSTLSTIGQPTGSTIGQPGGLNTPTPNAATPQPGTDQSASGATPGSSGAGITPASNMPGASSNSPLIGGGPIIGVSSISKLQSIKEINGKDHYNDWQFVYDPRLEQQTLGAGGAQAINPVGAGINPIGGPTQIQGPGQGPGFGQQGPTTTPQPMTQPRINQ
jgi:type II secretory pathway pseudopilin PulG